MKKIMVLVLGMLLMTSAASAAGKWELQLGAGADILASGFNSDYNIGLGLDLGIGYNFTQNFSLWLNSNPYELLPAPVDATLIADEVVLSGRYTVSGPGVKPYFQAGLGSFVQIASSGGYSFSTSDVMAQAGIGVKIPAGKNLDVFVEGKGTFVFATGTTAVSIPINAGVAFGL